MKVKHHQNTGLTAPQKFLLQLAAAILLRDRLPEASSFIQARSPQPEPERLLHELCLPS